MIRKAYRGDATRRGSTLNIVGRTFYIEIKLNPAIPKRKKYPLALSYRLKGFISY